MGKRSRMPGLPKIGKAQEKQRLAALGMLLGAEWDNITKMFLRAPSDNNRARFFDRDGHELGVDTIKKRSRIVQNRQRNSFKTPKSFVSADLWSRKLANDMLKPSILNTITSEGNQPKGIEDDEQPDPRHIGNDILFGTGDTVGIRRKPAGT